MRHDPDKECAVWRERLTDYLAGELPVSEKESVRRHLENCDVCRALSRELATTLDLARNALADPALAAGIADRLRPELRAGLVSPPLRFRRAQWLDRRWLLPAAAAVVALMGFVAGSQLRSWRSAPAADGYAKAPSPAPLPELPPAIALARKDRGTLNDAAEVTLGSDGLSSAPHEGVVLGVGAFGTRGSAVAAAARSPERRRLNGPAGAPDSEKSESDAAVSDSESLADVNSNEAFALRDTLPATAPPAKARQTSAARLADKPEAEWTARLQAIQVPAPNFDGVTAREAVERLSELAAMLPEAAPLRIIAWAGDSPSKPPAEAGAHSLNRDRKERRLWRATEEQVDGAGTGEPEPMEKERITLLEAIRRLAEHYDLESRIEGNAVIFSPRVPPAAP